MRYVMLLLVLLAGCGPSGRIASYNPTDEVVMVTVNGIEEGIAPGKTRLFRFRGSPFTVVVAAEDGSAVETVEATPRKGQRWLVHHVGGDRCFGVADFGNLFQPDTDGALSGVSCVSAAPWAALDRELDFWPGQKLPLYSEDPEVWGMVAIDCNMCVDAPNTHAAIHGRLHELKPE
jgi:hypothetical protein